MSATTTTTSIDDLRELARQGSYDIAPISRELYADDCTTIMLLKRLQNVSHHVYLLESVENSQQGRYTFLGYHPSMEITCKDGRLRITRGDSRLGETAGAGDDGQVAGTAAANAGAPAVTEVETDDPALQIREVLARHRSPEVEGLPPFTGGLVGYFGYDYLKYAEPTLTLDAADEEGFNDVDLMLFDKVIAFDNVRQKIVLIANVRLDDLETDYPRALADLDEMARLVKSGEMRDPRPGHVTSEVRQLFDKQGYCDIVERAKGHIREGDIFQVVLSNRLDADYEGDLLDTYRVLRTVNPSPYMFYFASDDIEMAGASPETLVKLDHGTVFTFPLAGTRPRGDTEAADREIERGLLADEKELAEHNMLVDLGRNDLGKICELGSVKVPKHLVVERFSHVMHLGSTVQGTLRHDLDALDAIGSVLPAGTLSGAPKIRAAQIINDLEDCKRGVYGGAIGYLSFTGDMDMCIAIRLVFKKNGKVFVRSGAGIVADSVPENEYQETINKAKAVMVALDEAEGGLES